MLNLRRWVLGAAAYGTDVAALPHLPRQPRGRPRHRARARVLRRHGQGRSGHDAADLRPQGLHGLAVADAQARLTASAQPPGTAAAERVRVRTASSTRARAGHAAGCRRRRPLVVRLLRMPLGVVCATAISHRRSGASGRPRAGPASRVAWCASHGQRGWTTIAEPPPRRVVSAAASKMPRPQAADRRHGTDLVGRARRGERVAHRRQRGTDRSVEDRRLGALARAVARAEPRRRDRVDEREVAVEVAEDRLATPT